MKSVETAEIVERAIGAAKICAAQIGVVERRPAQIATHQDGALERRVVKHGPIEIRFG